MVIFQDLQTTWPVRPQLCSSTKYQTVINENDYVSTKHCISSRSLGTRGIPQWQSTNMSKAGASDTQLTFLGSHFSSPGPQLSDQVGKHLGSIYVPSNHLCLEVAFLRVSLTKSGTTLAFISLRTLLPMLPLSLKCPLLFSFEVTHS